MKIQFSSSVLFVKDIDKSRAFYVNLMHQEPVIDMGLNISFGGFSLWQREHAFGIIHGDARHDPAQGEPFEMSFESPDIEELYEKIKQEGYELVHDLFEQPWAQKVFRFYDPDRNVVEVGEPMDCVHLRLYKAGKTPAEIAAITAYTEEMVKADLERLK